MVTHSRIAPVVTHSRIHPVVTHSRIHPVVSHSRIHPELCALPCSVQQCGRFHDLSAFDGNRKSCRDQLSKHNARRRRRAQVEQHKSKQAEQVCISQHSTGGVVLLPGCPRASPLSSPHAPPRPAVQVGIITGGDDSSDVGRIMAALMTNPSQLHALRLLLGVQTHPALPPMQPFSEDPGTSASGGGTGDGVARAGSRAGF